MLELHSYRFEYRVSPEAASRSLTEVLGRPEWKAISGDVSHETVKLQKKPWRSPGSVVPVFVGHFYPNSEGCALVGRFRMRWTDLMIFVLLFTYFGYRLFNAAFWSEHREGYVAGWRGAEVAIELQGIALILLMVLIFWVLGTFARKAIINAIEASI